MSDEGGFWRARHPLNSTAAARAIKPTEDGGAAERQNTDKPIVNTGWFQITTPPHSGEGCGDRLHSEMSPSQRTDFLLKWVRKCLTSLHHFSLHLKSYGNVVASMKKAEIG